jgi:putative ubiquitin-RnfH superfamily antitoxin RatB of RatAB toxin-antitoxin module
MPERPAQISVQIVRAYAHRSIIKCFDLAAGALIADALSKASVDADFRGVDLMNSPVGIFGKLTAKDQALKDGDRIEIYRPLAQEPKLARRKRAATLRSPRGGKTSQ